MFVSARRQRDETRHAVRRQRAIRRRVRVLARPARRHRRRGSGERLRFVVVPPRPPDAGAAAVIASELTRAAVGRRLLDDLLWSGVDAHEVATLSQTALYTLVTRSAARVSSEK